MSGLPFNDFLGKIHFYLFFFGVNLTFFPQHFLGISGHPRRICDFPDAFVHWNYYSSLGAFISSISTLFFIFLLYSLLINKKSCLGKKELRS
jgi:cytochrome c oxidase subunit 1